MILHPKGHTALFGLFDIFGTVDEAAILYA